MDCDLVDLDILIAYEYRLSLFSTTKHPEVVDMKFEREVLIYGEISTQGHFLPRRIILFPSIFSGVRLQRQSQFVYRAVMIKQVEQHPSRILKHLHYVCI